MGSSLEDDLSKLLSLPRAISRLPARKGTPKIRHPNERAYVQSNRATNFVHVYQPLDNESVRVEDDGNGTLRLTLDIPKYRPVNVARALGRMLLFVVNAHEPGYDRVRSWVRGEIDWFPIPLVTLNFPSAGFNRVQLMVHRYTRSPSRNILRITFLYSSFLITMPVPMDEWSLPEGLEMVNYPAPYQASLLANTSVLWVRDNEPDEGGTSEVVMSYGQRRKIK
jgi:hypothetical protein